MKIISCIFLLLLSTWAHAFGEQHQWSSGWAQGTYEYAAVMDEKNSLYIACPDQTPVSMVATIDGEKYGSYANKPFTIIVNGTAYEKPYETQSKPDAANYYQMWESLISAREIKLTTPDGKSLLLPINNAAKVIPSNKSNDFHCSTGFGLEYMKAKRQADAPTNTTPLQPTELSVGWYNHDAWKIPVLQITSRTDDVFIQNIILNRGNCRITVPGERPSNPRLPARLKFGTEIKFYVASLCQILEADVITNRGTITYTFQ